MHKPNKGTKHNLNIIQTIRQTIITHSAHLFVINVQKKCE